MNKSIIEKDPSCRNDFDPKSLSADAALEQIKSGAVRIKGIEKIAIREALNRILAEDIRSHINVPTGTNSAMDGYAVNSGDIPSSGNVELHVSGTAWAGKPYDGKLTAGSCVRIMTGAIMPEGADTVIIQEDVQVTGSGIIIDGATRKGDNVRQAGEDIAAGDLILSRGRRLNPADIGLIASLGIAEVCVVRRLRVAFFSTGDELRSIGETLSDGAIYDSNRYTLYGMLERMGADIIDMGVIKDDRDALEEAFSIAAANADVLITSGGVSVGEADYIKEILAKLGQVDFWKVAIKPGRPLAFGQVGNALFFGLPGNPVSVMVTFYEFVQPALRKMIGEDDAGVLSLKARCDSKLKKRPGRVEYQRGILQKDQDGDLVVVKTGAQGSGILRSMSQANCFIILPIASSGVEPGEFVDIQPFSGLV
jgi:molybdopterin molybdotransferase